MGNNHPYRAGPFYLLLPLNTQPAKVTVNLAALPGRPALPALAPASDDIIEAAADLIARARRPMIKAGGGTRGHDIAVRDLAAAAGAAVVLSPGSTGVLPDADPQKKVVASYKREYESRFKQEVSTFGGHAYDDLMLAVEAIQRAGTTDKARVRDALEATRGYVGTGGVVNMSAQDHMGLDLTAFRMLEVRAGDCKLVAPGH